MTPKPTATLGTASEAGALCVTKDSPHGVRGATYRRYVTLSGAPDAVSRDVSTGAKKYDLHAVEAWNKARPGAGSRTDIARRRPTQITDYQPKDRVYRYWDTGASGMQPQHLTVVRINRITVTVRTDQGNEFRMNPADIAGYVTPDMESKQTAQDTTQ